MSDILTLTATPRQSAGKGSARNTRAQGQIPAIIYGGTQPPHMVSVEQAQFSRQIATQGFASRQIELDIAGEKCRVLTRDIQYHPVTEGILHVDFLRVTQDTRVTVSVPVLFRNEEQSPGLKRGGVLNVVRHEIEISASVAHIPERFEIDLSGTDIGASIHVSTLDLPEGVSLTIKDRDFTIATIAAPSSEQEESTEEEEGEEETEAEAEDEKQGD